MKLIMEQWRHFKKNHGKEIITEVEFKNIGELLSAMKTAIGEKSRQTTVRTASDALGDVADVLAPGANAAGRLVRKFFDLVRGQVEDNGKIPPKLKDNPALLALFVEPDMSAVVANNIENQMIQKLQDEIEELVQTMAADPDADPYEMKLPEMNMTKFLTKFISDEYDGTILKPKDESTS